MSLLARATFVLFFVGSGLLAEPIYSIKSSKSGLTWYSQSELGIASTINSNHGKAKDIPVIGVWNDSGVAPLAISSSKKKKTKLVWQLSIGDGQAQSVTFGNGASGVLAGFDIDGNGIADIATVNGSTMVVRTNPFVESESQDYSLSFASTSNGEGFPLALNLSGDKVRVGFLTVETLNGLPRYYLSLRDLEGSLIRRQLGGLASRDVTEAYGIQTPGGEDAILIVTRERRSVEVTILLQDGTIMYREKFRGKQNFGVGDYSEAEGEEFIVQRKRTMRIVNPFSNQIERGRLENGKLINSILAFGLGNGGSSNNSSGGGGNNGGGSEKGFGNCDKFLPAPDGLNNFLAKNSDHGGIVYLTPDGSYSDGKILHHKTLKVLQDTRYTGVANGGRGHFRIPGSLPMGKHVFSAVKAGKRHCWRIPDGMSRVD